MRIISGLFKGKKILQPKDRETRPLKDLTKESIFNILKHSNLFEIDIEKSNILDLFSGVGSFGIECLSRGAEKVTFCENYRSVLTILQKNISNLDLDKNSNIISKDIFDLNSQDFIDKKFEIIFLDPPYRENRLKELLEKLINFKILKKNGIFIIHRHKKEKDEFPSNFKILKEKNYGISKIIIGI